MRNGGRVAGGGKMGGGGGGGVGECGERCLSVWGEVDGKLGGKG